MYNRQIGMIYCLIATFSISVSMISTGIAGQIETEANEDTYSCKPGAPPRRPRLEPPDADVLSWLPPEPAARYRANHISPSGEAEWKIIAVGDIMNSREVLLTAMIRSANKPEGWDAYESLFESVRSIISEADLAIGNLEFPILASRPPSGCTPFNGQPAYLTTLKQLGFDVLFTANNHAFDQGSLGVEGTLNELQEQGISPLGSNHINKEWKELLYVDIGSRDKLKLAFLNYTSGIYDGGKYGGFHKNLEHLLFGRNVNYAFFNKNERLLKKIFGLFANWLFPSALISSPETFVVRVASKVAEARANGAQYVVAFMHWGQAMALYPTPDQRELARRMCEAGVDAVIGAGPHVIQPVELVRGQSTSAGSLGKQREECLVAYSLGNFVGGTLVDASRYGMVLELTLAKDSHGVYVQNYQPNITYIARRNSPREDLPWIIELERRTLEQFLSQLPQHPVAGVTATTDAPASTSNNTN